MSLNYLLVARVQKNLQLGTPNQVGVEGSLKFTESFSWFESLWGLFSLDVWRFPFDSLRVILCRNRKTLQGFLWAFVLFRDILSLACLPFRQQPPGKCYRRQQWSAGKCKGESFHKENTYSALCFSTVSLCVSHVCQEQSGEISSLKVLIWYKSFGREFPESERALVKHWLDRWGRKELFPTKMGVSCGRLLKMSPILSHKGPDSMWPLMGV